jgi:hypothetical protein
MVDKQKIVGNMGGREIEALEHGAQVVQAQLGHLTKALAIEDSDKAWNAWAEIRSAATMIVR